MINPLRLNIPSELKTERLHLRTPTENDGATIIDAVRSSIEELKAWMPWATEKYDVNDAGDWCKRAASRLILREAADYLLFHRERHIGAVSVFSRGWDVPRFEIGYWLATNATGHGYMTEAVKCATEMTFDSLQARRIEIRCDARNKRSRAVAERAGFALEGIHRNLARSDKDELLDDCVYAMVR